jgi:DNA-3-methyladenine glycosylase I
MDQRTERCGWVPLDKPLYVAYHDEEWGVPSYDDRHLLEMLILEGAQAGLSWETILRKRAGYRLAFADFDVGKMAAFDQDHVERLMQDPAIVRNRLKIESAVQNARAALAVTAEFGSLSAYLWSFVGGAPIDRAWATWRDIAPETAESRAMSKELKRRGFRFVGPTTCYAFMEAVGLVNDHEVSCFRYEQVKAIARREPALL